jgi:hypothetical protein
MQETGILAVGIDEGAGAEVVLDGVPDVGVLCAPGAGLSVLVLAGAVAPLADVSLDEGVELVLVGAAVEDGVEPLLAGVPDDEGVELPLAGVSLDEGVVLVLVGVPLGEGLELVAVDVPPLGAAHAGFPTGMPGAVSAAAMLGSHVVRPAIVMVTANAVHRCGAVI